MRATGAFAVVAAAAAVLATQAVARVAFEDNKLNFQACDGKKLTARWRGNDFHLSVPGKTLKPAAPQLKYRGWDGACNTVSVDAKGRFKHTHDGATDADRLINYLSWDDTKWSATRAGTGFYHVFVADRDEAISHAQIKEAARWLKAHKSDSRAASHLAQELDEASAQ